MQYALRNTVVLDCHIYCLISMAEYGVRLGECDTESLSATKNEIC